MEPLTADEMNELGEIQTAVSLGCDDWYMRRRYPDLIARYRAACSCEVSMNCALHPLDPRVSK